jgi:hypothetical protein
MSGVITEPSFASTVGASTAVGPQAGKDDFQTIKDLHFESPWLDLILVVSGVTWLQDAIQAERMRRAEPSFVNPFPLTYELVTDHWFEIMVAIVLLFNCVFIGVVASVAPGEMAVAFDAVENVFVVFFFVEWCLRVTAFGWPWIFEFYNFCDTLLVFGTGVLVMWVLNPLGFDVTALRTLTVLRSLRLVRIIRRVRLHPFFKELWVLIYGLATSARPLLWTGLITMMILFTFSVMATQLFGRAEDFSDNDEVQELFGDLLRSLFTMFQIMTLDTYFFTIVRPIMEKAPVSGIFFIIFVMVGVFVFWNLITAVVVENAFKIAREDKENIAKDAEQEKRRELKVLSNIFLELDKDGSGDLTYDEFKSALSHPQVIQVLSLLDLNRKEMLDSWDILDDGDNMLTITEFTNGIRRMKGGAKSKDIQDVCKRLNQSVGIFKDVWAELEEYRREMHMLEENAATVCDETSEMVGLLREMFMRLTAFMDDTAEQDRKAAMKKKMAMLQG